MRNLIKKAGYTQRNFASLLGVDRTTVGKWELGIAYPRAKLLPKIAEYLNCSERDIIDAVTAVRKGDKEKDTV